MRIFKGTNTPSAGQYIFPIKTDYFKGVDKNNNSYFNLAVLEDSEIVKKSKKNGIYNKETVEFFLDTVNNLKLSRVIHNVFYSNVYRGVIFLPENTQVLKDYVSEIYKNSKTVEEVAREISFLTKGLPVFGNDGKKAYHDRKQYYTNNMGNYTLFNSHSLSHKSDYRHMLASILPLGDYTLYYSSASVVFSESMLVLPFFISLNDFIEFGDNNESLSHYLSKKENWDKINDCFKQGILPEYEKTSELSLAFYQSAYGNRSFLYPSQNGSGELNKIAELTKDDLIFWVNNYEQEFLSSPTDKLKKRKLNLWIKFVKQRGKTPENGKMLTKNDIDLGIQSIYNDTANVILQKATEEHGKEIAQEIGESVEEIITKLVTKRYKEKDSISFFLHSIKDNKPQYNPKNLSLFTLTILSLSLDRPGIFFKGGGTSNLEAIIMDTLETFDYNDRKLADLLLFLAKDSSIPKFNKTEWKEFVTLIKEQNIEDDGNLAFYASIVIPNNYGRNDSNLTINTKVLDILRNTERSMLTM